MYKNFIFDLYGTLVDINTNEWKPSLWKNMAILYSMGGAAYSAKELKKAYYSFIDDEIRNIPPDRYLTVPEPQILNVFKRLYTDKGVECSDDTAAYTGRVFRMLSLKYIRLYDGVKELFEAIRSAGGKIYLLSNAQRIFTEPEIRMLGIYDEFDDIMISSDEGCAKPDKMFYLRLLKKHNLKPEESIMIGNDHITDIKGSHEAGLDSLYLYTNISPEPKGEILAKYKIMSGSLIEARKALFGE
ncbi:MAG: HAD family hydrolase [Clostridia bacterium]|nr:HAD family hydrolase [Clostridia bacterium]